MSVIERALIAAPEQTRAALLTGPATVLVLIEPAPVWETSDWPQGYGEWVWEYPDGSGKASGPSHYWIEHSPWKVGMLVGIREKWAPSWLSKEGVNAPAVKYIDGEILWRVEAAQFGGVHGEMRPAATMPVWAVRTWATVTAVGVAQDEAGMWWWSTTLEKCEGAKTR